MRCGSYEARATQTQYSISSSDSQLQLSLRVDWPNWTLGCGILLPGVCMSRGSRIEEETYENLDDLLLKSIYLLRPYSIWASSQKHSSPDPCHRTNFLLSLVLWTWLLHHVLGFRKKNRKEKKGRRMGNSTYV